VARAPADLNLGVIRPEPEPEPEPERDRRAEPITGGMDESIFAHERLDAYRASTEMLVLADAVAAALPRGRAYLADQLRRAALSIALNVAEGAGELSADDKARFYRIARRSATECAAILDACRLLNLAPADSMARGRTLLLRIVAMLTALVLQLGQRCSGSGSGSGSGSQ